MFRALALAFAASLLTAACSDMFDDNGAAPSPDGEPASNGTCLGRSDRRRRR